MPQGQGTSMWRSESLKLHLIYANPDLSTINTGVHGIDWGWLSIFLRSPKPLTFMFLLTCFLEISSWGLLLNWQCSQKGETLYELLVYQICFLETFYRRKWYRIVKFAWKQIKKEFVRRPWQPWNNIVRRQIGELLSGKPNVTNSSWDIWVLALKVSHPRKPLRPG